MLILIAALATYRVTRFLVLDSLISAQRVWLHNLVLGRKPGAVRSKIHELLTCHNCLTVWVGAGVVGLLDAFGSVPMPAATWLAVASGALVIWRYVEE